jgi:hypothetical protein
LTQAGEVSIRTGYRMDADGSTSIRTDPVRTPHAPEQATTTPPRRYDVLLLLLTLARAEEHPTAPVAAMGGTSIADPIDLTTIRTNPAAVGLTERYDIQGLFAYGAQRDTRWGAAIADGRTNKTFSFGISYMGGITTPDFLPEELPPYGITGEEPVNRKQTHDIALAMAAPLFERRLALGLAGDVLIFNNTWNGKGVTGNLGAGIVGRPIDELSIGFAARDILPIAEQPDRPTTLALGLRGGIDEIAVGTAEVEYRTEAGEGLGLNLRAGAQAAIQVARLRAGWAWQGSTDTHLVTWGLGGSTAAGSVDYAMQIPVNKPGLKFGDVIHTLSVTLKTNAFDEDEDPTEDTSGAPLRWKPAR